MKKLLSISLGLLLMISFIGCLKDTAITDFKDPKTIIEMPYHGLEGFSSDAVLTAGQTAPIVIPLVVNVASPNPPSKDLAVTLAIDDALRTKYNASNTVQYEKLPTNAYSFTVTTGTIKAGYRLDTFYVTIFPDMVDPSKNFMLPIKIADAQGETISGNFGVAYLHMIGNPLAGVYTWNYKRWNNATGTGTPTTQWTDVATFLPADATTILVQSGYGDQNGLDIRYELTFTNTNGVLSNFSVRIYPPDVTASLQGAIGVLAFTDASILIADGASKHFKFTYAVVNSAGSPRYFTDEFNL